jgi:DNA-binding XRE family transcriptional regulator
VSGFNGPPLRWLRAHPKGVYKEQVGRPKGVSARGYCIPIGMRRATRKSPGLAGDIDWKQVGRRIRELRGFDMTQEEFASRIGVSQNHLSVIERGGREIGAAILLRNSRKYGKRLEWLLTGEG